jgi:geranylgeranylglycerol-phosphate geranylgeranyltransferase
MMERTYIIALLAFLAILGREIVKDIEDMEGDFDRQTLPKRIGARKAGGIASLSFLVAVALSPIPYFDGTFGIWYLAAVAFADAIFIYCSIVHFENPPEDRSWPSTACSWRWWPSSSEGYCDGQGLHLREG